MTITFREAAVPHKYRNRFLRDSGGQVVVGGSSSVGDGSSINLSSYLKKAEAETLYLKKASFDELFEKVTLSDGTTAIKAKMSLFSVGGLSAYGSGSGSGGGTSYNRLDAWTDYTSAKAGYVLSALLGNDLNSRVTTLEGKSYATSWNDLTTKPTQSQLTAIIGNAYLSPSDTTSALSEGTNLYFTDARAQSALSGHTDDTTIHITSDDRTSWDGKWDWDESEIKVVKVDSATSSDSCSGNSATATALETSRSIWGQSFDGSDDVEGDLTLSTVNGLGSDIIMGGRTNATYGGKWTVNENSGLSWISNYNTSTLVLQLNDNGNVGIGKSSPEAKLHVDGGIKIKDGLIEWDETNQAFKFNGNLYATGGISAYSGLGSYETLENLTLKNRLTTGELKVGNGSVVSGIRSYTPASGVYYLDIKIGASWYRIKVENLVN